MKTTRWRFGAGLALVGLTSHDQRVADAHFRMHDRAVRTILAVRHCPVESLARGI